MSDDASTTATEGAATGENVTNTPVTPEAPAAKTDPTTVEELPAFAQKMISDLRAEAAKHRAGKTQVAKSKEEEVTQAFEAKLAESNTAHQVTQQALASEQLKLAKVLTAIDAGVPTDKIRAFSSRLQGSTPEELLADAEQVKALFGMNPAIDPSQGRGAGTGKSGSGSDDQFANFILGKLNKE